MPFGGMAPFPYRLGGTVEEGWTAEQHARMCSDVAAAHATNPLAILVVTAGTTSTINWFTCRGGYNIGSVTATFASGTLTLDLGARYYDEDQLDWRSWSASVAFASTSTSGPVGTAITGDQIAITATSGDVVTVVIYGSVAERQMGDYGAELNKKNSNTEGNVPYAYNWLLEQQAAMGTAYSNDVDSLTRFELIARARMLGFGQRLPEAYAAQNGSPACADQKLGYWCTVLGISPGLPDWVIRRLANAKTMLSNGVNDEVLVDAIQQVVGAAFVGLVRTEGTLAAPPYPTWWRYGPEGPAMLALDSDGCWLSRRCHLTASLTEVAGRGSQSIARIANNELRGILNGMLPAVSTWNWAFHVGDTGFVLGTDRLGRDAL